MRNITGLEINWVRWFVRSALVASALSLTSLAACGPAEGMGPTGMLCGGSRTGITECSGVSCQAGQYCEFPLNCSPGCTSDSNCAAGDRCVREAGAAVGACAPCTPTPAPTSMPTESPLVTRCKAAMMRGFTCMTLNNQQYAAGVAACDSALTDTERQAIATCVESAGGNCTMVSSCFQSGGGGGGGGCTSDSMCNTAAGLAHEICSGGLCVPGCRVDADCGSDFVCDTDARVCMPE